ncbi:hypothetical protein BO78DRAFT_415634 [Aspergillus sclerotiicarbonarius CBS 121057]|uniref:Uncharacterized protein n=1 Tax=Aspergillus sclerotiicarbonarius (strain CBS 121057 / IBT 28362) TaxID=1448318 RepID=A0A319EHB7_ASPSB|nr:hypothetical protein BO78DRAFT_415634 [Aspergillus sclerotiicarbonarius CBS 121057]
MPTPFKPWNYTKSIMYSELPDIAGLKRAVQSGQRIGPEDVCFSTDRERIGRCRTSGAEMQVCSSLETITADVDPTKTATAQNLATKKMNFEEKLDELSKAPKQYNPG